MGLTDTEMIARYRAGKTMQQIADEGEVSRQRVQQILARYGVNGTETYRRRVTEYQRDVLDRAMPYLGLFPIREIAAKLGVPTATLSSYLIRNKIRPGTALATRLQQGQRGNFRERWSREELIAWLHRAASELGGSFRVEEYDAWARVNQAPLSRTIYARLGRFSVIMPELGYRGPSTQRRSPRSDRIPRERCEQVWEEACEEFGGVVTTVAYQRLRNESHPEWPCLAIMRRNLSWRQLTEQALERALAERGLSEEVASDDEA